MSTVSKRKQRKTARLGFISKGIFLLNVFAAAALLLSYLAPYVNPRTFWPIAFLGIGYSTLLVINCLFVVYWLARRPRIALLSLLVFLVGWGPFRKHIGFSKRATEQTVSYPDSSHLRVMSYNVHFFSPAEETSNTFVCKSEMLALIDSIAPDILCLQEFLTREKGEHNVLETFRREHGYVHQHFFASSQNEYEAYGLAILSKYPIVASGKLDEHWYGINGTIYADVAYGDDTLRIYNVHLRSFGFQKEDYEFIAAPPKTLEQDVSSTRRIGWRLRHAFEARSEPAEALRKHRETADEPYLIVGDFNDTPLSYAVNHVASGMQNAFRIRGQGWGETYNGAFPNFQIDYILASKDLAIHNYQVIKKKLSDHYPVWADISLK